MMLTWGRISRQLDSPVVATWASLSVKFASHALVLPLALARLGVEELSLWLLLYSITAIGVLVDFGFSPTFVRLVAYAHGADGDHPHKRDEGRHRRLRDFNLSEIVSAMDFLYVRLLILCAFVLCIFGSIALVHPISQIDNYQQGWIAWGATAAGTCLTLYNSMFGSFLQGVNQIALYRRWEAISGLSAVVAALICLMYSSELLFLVLALQVAPIANNLVNRVLVGRFGFFDLRKAGDDISLNSPVIDYVWQSAWRSGLGVAATIGATNGGNLLPAQLVPAATIAPYLVAQRLLMAAVTFAAPLFNTAIPSMVVMFRRGEYRRLLEQSGRRMFKTNWIIAISVVAIAYSGSQLMGVLNSETKFVSPLTWFFLGLAALFERIGAMHIQLYSVTNHIVWHIANGVTGTIFAVLFLPSFILFGVCGVAATVLIAYGCFYTPYCMRLSYREFGLKPQQFDVSASLAPLVFVAVLLIPSFWVF